MKWGLFVVLFALGAVPVEGRHRYPHHQRTHHSAALRAGHPVCGAFCGWPASMGP